MSDTHHAVQGRCFLCGATDGPVVLSEAGYSGRTCACGIVYIDPTPAADVADLVEDGHFAAYYELPARIRLAWVRRFKRSGRLLEVGCGRGYFLELARTHGFEVRAIEPNPACAREVTTSLGIPVEQAFVESTAELPGSYDVVFHVDLLSHFPDPLKALSSMAALLRPDGVLCFEVGVFAGFHPGFYRWVGRIGYPQHRWLYSERAIAAVLGRAGLELVAVRRFTLLPSTVLSTIGNALVREHVSRPTRDDGTPVPATGAYRIYSRLQYLLRYRIGAVGVPVGPRAMFVAARLAPGRPPVAHEPMGQ